MDKLRRSQSHTSYVRRKDSTPLLSQKQQYASTKQEKPLMMSLKNTIAGIFLAILMVIIIIIIELNKKKIKKHAIFAILTVIQVLFMLASFFILIISGYRFFKE